MTAVLEGVAVLALLVLVGVIAYVGITSRGRPPGSEVEVDRTTVSDRHTHRWTRWRIIDERKIHLYGEVDEGRELPDRVDVVLRRECARCGLPQTQTVRGLDPKRRD